MSSTAVIYGDKSGVKFLHPLALLRLVLHFEGTRKQEHVLQEVSKYVASVQRCVLKFLAVVVHHKTTSGW